LWPNWQRLTGRIGRHHGGLSGRFLCFTHSLCFLNTMGVRKANYKEILQRGVADPVLFTPWIRDEFFPDP
jgi:hypothetical protein